MLDADVGAITIKEIYVRKFSRIYKKSSNFGGKIAERSTNYITSQN